MRTFGKHNLWILTILLTAPVVALAAGVPNLFTAGQVISSVQMNQNFASVTDRVTTLETSLSSGLIPQLSNPNVATNAQYDAAPAVRLPLYQIVAGENGSNEATASCKTGDLLLSGGCVARDVSGAASCMVERSYFSGPITWLCRAGKPNGLSSDCRATPYAVCLKSY